MTDFNKYFAPSSLAMMGASADRRKWGYRILSNIIRGGFEGRIYPINPKGEDIRGLKVYKSMADLPERPDLAIIVVPPVSIVEAVGDCIARGITEAVVVTAGFAEIGEQGAALQAEMLKAAREGGLRLVGPNCFGILSPWHKLYAQMPPVFPPAGAIAIVSQSGNVGGTMGQKAAALDFGVSRLVSLGNEADLQAEDFIQFLGRDEKTEVILSYIEGFKDGRRFFEAARDVTRRKPLVMIKVGETEAGASAARSHTASLSGADAVFAGVCRQAGIVRVYNMAELLNVGYGFLCNPLPRGRRVGIATLGGGWGVLAADACAKLGLDVVKLPGLVLRELDSFLPSWWSRNNPVDLVAGDADQQMKVIDVLARCDDIDSIIALGMPFPSLGGIKDPNDREERKRREQTVIAHYADVFRQVRAISQQYRKPIVVAAELSATSAELERRILRAVTGVGEVCYALPDEAAMVLAAMVRYSQYRQRAG